MRLIKDKTLLLLSLLGAAAFSFMMLVTRKPNRIAQGEPFSGLAFFGRIGVAVLLLWLLLIALSFYGGNRSELLVYILTAGLTVLLLWGLQDRSGHFIAGESSARISLSSGFFVQIFTLYMLFSTYGHRIRDGKWVKWIMILSVLGILSFFTGTGAFDELSLIREYNIKKTQFSDHLRIHVLLTLASVLTGALIAIPLGFTAYARKKLEDKIMIPLSIIETIPSLSLFGILLVPLAGLGRLPFFDAIGVSGIGWAPAYIALTLYTLLPIGRNTLTGFYSVDKNVIEAARGMGMSRSQILKKIELPLAFPVIFTGIRIAFIQTIGGAVLAGLVGGGGMGTFVFLGLGEASPDLILLGVLPIVFFTVVLDHLLKAFEKTMRRFIYD